MTRSLRIGARDATPSISSPRSQSARALRSPTDSPQESKGACAGTLIALRFPHGAAVSRPAHRRGRYAAMDKPQLTQLVEQPPEGSRVAARDQIRRVSHACAGRSRLGAPVNPHRARLDAQISGDRRGCVIDRRRSQAYLDGELCGVRADGITSFSMIQSASDSGNAAALVFFLFDLLFLDGEDLCNVR